MLKVKLAQSLAENGRLIQMHDLNFEVFLDNLRQSSSKAASVLFLTFPHEKIKH